MRSTIRISERCCKHLRRFFSGGQGGRNRRCRRYLDGLSGPALRAANEEGGQTEDQGETHDRTSSFMHAKVVTSYRGCYTRGKTIQGYPDLICVLDLTGDIPRKSWA